MNEFTYFLLGINASILIRHLYLWYEKQDNKKNERTVGSLIERLNNIPKLAEQVRTNDGEFTEANNYGGVSVESQEDKEKRMSGQDKVEEDMANMIRNDFVKEPTPFT